MNVISCLQISHVIEIRTSSGRENGDKVICEKNMHIKVQVISRLNFD